LFSDAIGWALHVAGDDLHPAIPVPAHGKRSFDPDTLGQRRPRAPTPACRLLGALEHHSISRALGKEGKLLLARPLSHH
jgi:hypothetical protein